MKPIRTLSALALALALLMPTPALAAARDDSPLFEAIREGRVGLQHAESQLAEARAAYLDVPLSRAGVSLNLAKMSYDTANLMLILNHDPAAARAWIAKGRHYLREGQMSLMPSRGAEARGMLIDGGSMPKTEAGVVALVEKLHQAHFNVLLPEVFRRGYTMYDSRFTDRDPEFAGAPDVLAVLVREAHKRGMEVQPWIWSFRVRSPGYGNPILSRLPALASRTPGKEERFMSAASPQARDYLLGILTEMSDRYDLDGVLLDYIRYDEEIQSDDISRTRFALEYRARHGKLPPEQIPPHSQLMVEWQLWREQQVNLAVQEISRSLKAQHPHFNVAVAVFRGESYARLVKMQHWRHWSNNNWVDWASPMLYTGKNEDLGRWLKSESDGGTRTNLMYPILGVHRMDDQEELLDELAYLNERNEPGAFVFALAHFDMGLLEELKNGPFRTEATLPHRNLVRAARRTLAETNRYLTRVFSRADFDTAATARMLYHEVNSVAQNLPLDELPYWQNGALVARLEQIKALAGVAPMPAPVRREFLHRLDYTETLVRANQHEVEATRYVPTTLPPIKVEDGDPSKPRD